MSTMQSILSSSEAPPRLDSGQAHLYCVDLDEVQPLHGDLLLLRPRAAELALRADEDRAGLRVDEELRHRAVRQPFRIRVHDRDDVRGLAIDRNLARPCERRPAGFAGLAIRRAVRRVLGSLHPAAPSISTC